MSSHNHPTDPDTVAHRTSAVSIAPHLELSQDAGTIRSLAPFVPRPRSSERDSAFQPVKSSLSGALTTVTSMRNKCAFRSQLLVTHFILIEILNKGSLVLPHFILNRISKNVQKGQDVPHTAGNV